MEQGLNMNELKEKRLNLLVALGEETHNLVRGGSMTISDKLRSLSEEIKKADIQISKTSNAVDISCCPQCHEALQADAMFCSKCGFAVKEYFAAYVAKCHCCGTPMKAEQNYCVVCGTKQSSHFSIEKSAE